MAYRGEIVRLEKWINNTHGDYIPKKTENLIPSMTTQMLNWLPIIVKTEGTTKLILAEAATQTIMNPFYLSFAHALMSLRHSFRGPQLIATVDIQLSKWVGLGLDRDILERIRNTIFTLAAPNP